MEINKNRPHASKQQSLEPLSKAQKTLHLLVIDDDPSDSELYAHYLLSDTEFAYELTCVETGEEGLTALQARSYDCILLDFNLPDFTGVELIDKLNAISHSRTPILMLTGAGSEDIAAEAMRAGAADYLPKRLVSADSLKLTIIMAMDKFETLNTIFLKTQRLEKINADLQLKQDAIQRLHHTVSTETIVPAKPIQDITGYRLHDADSMTGKPNDSSGSVLKNVQAINDDVHTMPNATQLVNGKYNIE